MLFFSDVRFDGNSIQSLKQNGSGLIPITSPAVSKRLTSTPSILKRGKRRKRRVSHSYKSILCLELLIGNATGIITESLFKNL